MNERKKEKHQLTYIECQIVFYSYYEIHKSVLLLLLVFFSSLILSGRGIVTMESGHVGASEEKK